MAEFVTPAIPAGQLVTVLPSVLPAGGNALDLIETILTENWRVPIGSVYQFSSPTAVAAFFGQNTTLAGLASVYFNGFDNSNAKPGALNFWQHAETAVGAWLLGGSLAGVPLTTLQGYSGTLSVTIDSVLKSASVNLSSATSFTGAAQIIQNDLGITGEADGSVTATVGATALTSTTTGTVLTLGTLQHGYISVGDTVTANDGTNTLNATIVNQLTGTPGGSTGATFTISAAATPGNLASSTVTSASSLMNVTAVGSGQVSPLDLVTGTGLAAHTYIASQASGTTGGIGFYNLTGAQQTMSGGAAETVTATQAAVLFDGGVSNGFKISSGTTGVNSTITFGTGAMATDLLLTQALGATLSQGAAAYTPASSMNGITAITQNWVTFQTDWEATDADKEGFAAWTSGQNGGTANRYGYLMWETNVLDTEQGGPSAPVAYIIAGNLSGTVMIYQNPNITTLPGEKAAFMGGMVASVDYTETNGDVTFAGKHQAGLLPDITNGNIATILAGNPQVSGSYGYGINFYGDYTTANQAFINWQRGLISGPFTWADDYFNEIWLNNQMQLALMELETTAKSLPYVQAGYAQVDAVLLDPIQQAQTFGMIVAGVALSNSQIAQINNAAGNNQAAQAVAQQGYYLQIKPAIAQVRAGRTSPPITLFYATGESIQSITLNSVQVQ